MPKLDWGVAGTRFYEAGIDRGVLYLAGETGVPWVGLTSVEESPTGGEAKAYYIDGVKYLNISSAEEFEATLTAYTYPTEFGVCDGTARVRPGLSVTQQRRKSFNFSYRTKVGNDLTGLDHGYKIHLIYNVLAAPSGKSYSSTSDSTEVADFSWSLTTRPAVMTGYKRSAHVVIDSRETAPVHLQMIEDILYGSDVEVSRMPTLDELVVIYDMPLVLTVTDLGNGIYRIDAPDDAMVAMGNDTTSITWPTVIELDPDTYSISS